MRVVKPGTMNARRLGAHRQTGWPGLHAVLLTALAGGHGLVGRGSAGLGAEGILGEFLITATRKKRPSLSVYASATDYRHVQQINR